MLGPLARRFATLLSVPPRPRSVFTLNAAKNTLGKYLEVSISSREMAKKNFYAVAKGRRPGLYRSWPECQAQVDKFAGCVFKGFASEKEALDYLAQYDLSPGPIDQEGDGNVDSTAPLSAPNAAAPLKPALLHVEAAVHTPWSANQSREDDCVPSTSGRGRTVRIEFDGASKRNPGPAGLGAVLFDAETGAQVARIAEYMGSYHTNNQAEYAGLIAGLQKALSLGYDSVEVQGDSMLIVNQVLGRWQVKNDGLRPYHAFAVALSKRFKKFKAKQVPREQNTVADALSNEAIDSWNKGLSTTLWTLESAGAREGGHGGAKRVQRRLEGEKGCGHESGGGGDTEEDEGKRRAFVEDWRGVEPEMKRLKRS